MTLLALIACSPLVHDRLNVRTDGALLPVEVHGDMDSGTLLLVESGGPSGPAIAQRDVGYFPFQDTLEPHLAVALYDRRGTGNATGDYRPEDQSMAQLVSDLRAVIRVLSERYRPERLVLMGHSFGAYTSALLQLEHPGEASAWVAAAPAILEGPDALYVPYRHAFVCRVALEQPAEPLWEEILSWCEAHPEPPAWDTPELDQLWAYLGEIEDRLEPWPSMRAGGLLSAVFASHYGIVDAQLQGNRISEAIAAEPGREDLIPELGALDVPTVVLTGEFDGTAPTELGSAMIDALPDASLTELADAGHYPMVDHPERFAEAVLALVEAL